MDTRQLVQELDALRGNFAKYRVEMALHIDSLERRLNAAESALPHSGRPKAASQCPPLRSTLSPAPASNHGHSSTMPGFTEHRRHPHAPLPIITAPAPSSHLRAPAFPTSPYVHQQQPSQTGFAPVNTGSSENATFLPFVLEKIAASSQKKSRGDNRTCACGRPTFDVKCFRDHHFGWCLSHQRPIMHGLQNCSGRDYRNCQPVYWEKHADWELLVKTSFDGGHLGTKKVKNLYVVLFPEELYPGKYQDGCFMG
ncbi:hypothetical protein ST47_g7239 [Ascochyta rabiei]|uniref:Uncharacterized protein n=2 Tax=Didymella rabiei TaxID=5454 RepID=A0A163B7Q5_DIDRA|nr:hypothetical protein ST47_g7239 [Ascochyta rabiei]